MPKLRVLTNHAFPKGSHRAYAERHLRNLSEKLSQWFGIAWFQAFPLSGPPDGPQTTPPLVKRTCLKEGALLSQDLDAIAKKRLPRP